VLPFSTVFSDAQVLPFSIMIYRKLSQSDMAPLGRVLDAELAIAAPGAMLSTSVLDESHRKWLPVAHGAVEGRAFSTTSESTLSILPAANPVDHWP
jgi:hypothetical protein